MSRLPKTLAFAIVTGALLASGAAVLAEDPASLQVLHDHYPQAFFFRSSEGFAASGRSDC